MKRFHVHATVADQPASIHYYSALFAAEPTTVKPDYAKWALDDPRVNFAISALGASPDKLGVDHLGIQVESGEELVEGKGCFRAYGAGSQQLAEAKI